MGNEAEPLAALTDSHKVAESFSERPSCTKGQYQYQYQSKSQLLWILQELPEESFVVIPDLVRTAADICNLSRRKLLREVLGDWFAGALGFPVLEVQLWSKKDADAKKKIDDACGHLHFEVRLDADHAAEVERAGGEKAMRAKLRELLVKGLPAGRPEDVYPKLDAVADGEGIIGAQKRRRSVEIERIRPGSIYLVGSLAVGLVALLALTRCFTSCRCSFCCACQGGCPCLFRQRSGPPCDAERSMRAFKDRGADFDVKPDGSAVLHIPASQDVPRASDSSGNGQSSCTIA